MPVPSLSHVILFVQNPAESAHFYTRLLELTPIEEHPTFVCYKLSNGTHLGLWSSKTARPAVKAGAGGSEICFAEDDVEGLYKKWSSWGIPMAQEPTCMDGMKSTFVALDPDGHRIRVFCLEDEESL